MKQESLKAIRNAYVIEETGYQAVQFALIHLGRAVGKRLNNKVL